MESGTAIATYGMAMIGESTIRGLVDDFAEQRTAGSLEQFAEALGVYFQAKLDAVTPSPRGDYKLPAGWPLGFVVGRYDGAVGRLLDVRVRPLTTRSETSRSVRAIRASRTGVEPARSSGWSPGLIRRRSPGSHRHPSTKRRLQLLRYDLILPQTVADAVGFARFLIQTAVGMQQFSDGTYLEPSEIPGCGGPTRVVTVSRSGAELMSPV